LIPSDLVPDRPIEVPPFPDERLPQIRLRSVPQYDPSLQSRPRAAAPATPLAPYLAPVRSSTARRQTAINVDALTAKIRSINLSLTAIESDLESESEWSVERLEAIGRDLSRLIDVADLSQLYYDALPAERRNGVEPLIDRGSIQAKFAQRVLETRVRLAAESRTSPSEALDKRLNRLEVLSRVIQRWNGDHSQ
jgi:hypothetical protein